MTKQTILLFFYSAGQGLPSEAGQKQIKALSQMFNPNALSNRFKLDKLKTSIILASERLGYKINGVFIDLNKSKEWFDVWLNLDLGENDDLECLLDDDLKDIRAMIIKEASKESTIVSHDGILMDLFEFNDLKRDEARFWDIINRLVEGEING
jgi:hypothetical protein